ncbi:hypothetical protein N7465_008952 [Penicillium sp. CMV-2018d]|nr:hypothetical protein N7465_008952 [Penicillium sp. CMV-2018d]
MARPMHPVALSWRCCGGSQEALIDGGVEETQFGCHGHDSRGQTLEAVVDDSEMRRCVCVFDVKCGGHAHKVEVVAGTGKRVRGSQIERDEKWNSCNRRHQGEPASATGPVEQKEQRGGRVLMLEFLPG